VSRAKDFTPFQSLTVGWDEGPGTSSAEAAKRLLSVASTSGPGSTDRARGIASTTGAFPVEGYYLDSIERPTTLPDVQARPEQALSTTRPQAISRIVSLPRSIPTRERYVVAQRWEGTVIEVRSSTFVARLNDLTDEKHPPERAVFALAEVDDDDRPLLQPGAVFYWSIGYHHNPAGTRTLSNDLRFRRLPQWTARDVTGIQESTEFDDLFTYERT
jgi:hypothetical protein